MRASRVRLLLGFWGHRTQFSFYFISLHKKFLSLTAGHLVCLKRWPAAGLSSHSCFRYLMIFVVPSPTDRYSDGMISPMHNTRFFTFYFCVTQTLTRRSSSQHFVPTDTAVSGTTDVSISSSVIPLSFRHTSNFAVQTGGVSSNHLLWHDLWLRPVYLYESLQIPQYQFVCHVIIKSSVTEPWLQANADHSCYPILVGQQFVSEPWYHGRITRERSLELLFAAGIKDG